MSNLKKSKGRPKSPSRQRYEREHPTVSFRLTKETYERLKRHLDGTGCSFADFVKDALGREESTVEKRILAREATQFEEVDDRLRCLEGMVHQILLDSESDPLCPACYVPLVRCQAQQIELDLGPMPIYACPMCDFFTNTYFRINPETIEWPQGKA